MKPLFLLASLACALQARAAVPALPPAVAEDALKTLKMLAISNPVNFGFSSQADVNAAALGPSLRQYFVGLDDLAAYRKGQDPFSIMQAGDRAEVVLVEAGGTARSLILFRYSDRPFDYSGVHRDAGWHAEEFGDVAQAKDIESLLGRSKGFADVDSYLIFVPALSQAQFLGSRAARQRSAGTAYALWDDDGGTTMKGGDSKRVEDLFAELQPLAQARVSAPSNGPGAGHP